MDIDLTTPEGRSAIFMDTLRWLQLGAPHGVVGNRNDVGFRMDHLITDAWEHDNDPYIDDYAGSRCGTVCCMRGHVELAQTKELRLMLDEALANASIDTADNRNHSEPVRDQNSIWYLFYPSITQLNAGRSVKGKQLPAFTMREVTAEWAAGVLHHYIETGEVDWKHGRHYVEGAHAADDRLLK